MDTLSIAKNIYRSLFPASVRNSKIVIKLKERLLGHDWAYNADYYDYVESLAAPSVGTMAHSIMTDFNTTSVVDVGCGSGALLNELRNQGCKEVFGLEYSEAGLKYCRSRGLSVKKFDLETDSFNDNRRFDVACSMEVAEHLPEIIADRYVNLLVNLSPVVVFTAAPPGQEGLDHVNLQPPSYWISKFQQCGFQYAEERSQRWRESWKATGCVEGHYHQNLLIFQRM